MSKEIETYNKAEFVKRNGMIADAEYVQWLSDLKKRYRQSQIKAAVRINLSMLEFYWELGRDIVALKAESHWGSGFFNQLSLDLKDAFPNEKGFSSRNIRYMKKWYLFYYEEITKLQQVAAEYPDQKLQQLAAQLAAGTNRHQVGDEFAHQAGDELPMPQVFAIRP